MERRTINLTTLLAALPSVQRFLQSIERALRDGHNIWVLLPDGVEPAFVTDILLRHLEGPGGMIIDIVDLDTAGAFEPFEVLKGIVERWEDVRGCQVLEDLVGPLRNATTPEPEVLLLKPREGGLALDSKWLTAIERWALACRRYASQYRRRLCIVASASSLPATPEPNITMAVRRWWGIPSALETQLACRLTSEEEGPVSLWREYLIPSLAGNDLTLGEHLWDAVIEPEDHIVARLAEYGRRRGWRKRDAEEVSDAWRSLPPGKQDALLPRSMFSFWARGWIVYTPEYGGEIHSALVALLEEDNHQEIAHRLWRAQAALLLPVVDSARVSIWEQLTRIYGRACISQSEHQDASPYPELGYIEKVLRESTIRESDKLPWLRAVRLVREIRNKLAHYNSISFGEFVEFWEHVSPLLKRR